jgi:hypothetical protein
MAAVFDIICSNRRAALALKTVVSCRLSVQTLLAGNRQLTAGNSV